MYQTGIIQVNREEIISCTCDRCKKVFSIEDDFFELQEFQHIVFTGGYASVFGDETNIECDLCQRCLQELVGEFCRTVDVSDYHPGGCEADLQGV
jgi:hypothetical protein